MRKKKPEDPLELICIQTLGSRVEAELAMGLLGSNVISAVVSTDYYFSNIGEPNLAPRLRILRLLD